MFCLPFLLTSCFLLAILLKMSLAVKKSLWGTPPKNFWVLPKLPETIRGSPDYLFYFILFLSCLTFQAWDIFFITRKIQKNVLENTFTFKQNILASTQIQLWYFMVWISEAFGTRWSLQWAEIYWVKLMPNLRGQFG